MRTFWILFGVQMLSLAVSAARLASSRPDPSGGRAMDFFAGVVLPLTLFGTVGLAVYLIQNRVVLILGTAILAWPLVGMAWGVGKSIGIEKAVQAGMRGDDRFPAGPVRELAHAVKDGDLAQVQARMLPVTDLKKRYNQETTLLWWAVTHAKTPAGITIVKALLNAGAAPDQQEDWPLNMAAYAAPKVTQMLLEAGADPNRVGSDGRPQWWTAIEDRIDPELSLLQVYLEHGADLTLRSSYFETGPVGFALLRENARAVPVLLKAGAPWQGDKVESQTVQEALAWQMERATGNGEMDRLAALQDAKLLMDRAPQGAR